MSVARPDETLLCPLCEYDLRGLTESRCPECGYRFDWEELRDPARRLHPYLFEHHPHRNIRSFVRTLLRGLRPRRFWSTLYPTQPYRPWRLALYFILICLAGVLPLIANFAFSVANTLGAHQREKTTFIAFLQDPRVFANYRRFYPNLTPQQIADRCFPPLTREQLLRGAWAWSMSQSGMRFQIPLLLWPVLTFAAMMIFRISMRRARVRTAHVARCVIYSADVVIFLNLLLAAVLILIAAQSLAGRGGRFEAFNLAYLGLIVAAWGFFAYRFTTALRLYLRFDHPRLTVLATQVLSLLALLVILSELYNRWRW